MNHKEAGQFWNESAESWVRLARAGYDIYRDHLNTPAFFAMLPEVKGLAGLDIGCGEGYNTRMLAKLGARVSAVDISDIFISYAKRTEQEAPLGIDYQVASAVDLPFAEGTFDFATAFMSLMDVPETERALVEVHRVLKPDGFLQFSIAHPCFDTPHRRNLRDANHRTYAIEVGDYFAGSDGTIDEWLFKAAPLQAKQGLRKFRLPRFRHTLSFWLNLLISTGFQLEQVEETATKRRRSRRLSRPARRPGGVVLPAPARAESGLACCEPGTISGRECVPGYRTESGSDRILPFN